MRKSFKILSFLVVITAVLSSSNIFAYYTIARLDGSIIPSHNGSYVTPRMFVSTAAMGYNAQVIDNIAINPSGDELDVRVKKYDDDIYGSWKIMKTGARTILTNSPAFTFQGGNFGLIIDSRWYYTKNTVINKADWALAN